MDWIIMRFYSIWTAHPLTFCSCGIICKCYATDCTSSNSCTASSISKRQFERLSIWMGWCQLPHWKSQAIYSSSLMYIVLHILGKGITKLLSLTPFYEKDQLIFVRVVKIPSIVRQYSTYFILPLMTRNIAIQLPRTSGSEVCFQRRADVKTNISTMSWFYGVRWQ